MVHEESAFVPQAVVQPHGGRPAVAEDGDGLEDVAQPRGTDSIAAGYVAQCVCGRVDGCDRRSRDVSDEAGEIQALRLYSGGGRAQGAAGRYDTVQPDAAVERECVPVYDAGGQGLDKHVVHGVPQLGDELHAAGVRRFQEYRTPSYAGLQEADRGVHGQADGARRHRGGTGGEEREEGVP